jgi:sulfatase maturation enzyme AslB (radical SAM superfamily)
MNLASRIRKLISLKNENKVPSKVVAAYNATRIVQNTAHFCHAPFSNLYFNTEGHVAVCWQTFHRAEQYTPEKSLMDIWKGLNFEKIRNGIKNNELDYGCTACKNHLLQGNYTNILAKAYDNDFPFTNYPSIIEFELSNTCNLGCTMCNGMLSSTIRKEREKLPPLTSPYGDKFLEELKVFIPYLKEARFNGGEPFLIKMYAQIWDLVAEFNPNLKMIIATNGTVLNSKVKEMMQRHNFHFNISIDGITKESYESIRKHGNFDVLMDNFLYFRDYCKVNNRNLCIMVNPMRQNWRDMPAFINFVNKHNVSIWFNTITKPAEQALWSLPAIKLKEIYETLSEATLEPFLDGDEGVYNYNINTYRNLVYTQIKTWWHQAEQHEVKLHGFVIDEDEPVKDKAMKKIQAYLLHREQDFKIAEKRIMETEQLVAPEHREVFFVSLLDSNPETIVTNCKEKTAKELNEIFCATHGIV